jgi:hypothetical protein
MANRRKKNIRIKSFILSSFLLVILFSYNNCTNLKIKKGHFKESQVLGLKADAADHEYKFTFLKHELRFNGAKLDSKVYSISNLSLYPHSDMYKEVVIFEDGRELVIPLKVNSLDPLRNSALLRLRSNKSQLKIYLR